MTRVRMPVRVRVEVTPDQVGDGLVRLVTSAVDAGLGRAVDRALTVHAVTRCRAASPDPLTWVRFSGDALPADTAKALESSLLTSVRLAASRLSLGDTVLEAASRDAGEPLDDDRVVSDATGRDGYRVPYYDSAGGPVDVQLHGLPAEPSPAEQPVPALRLSRFQTTESLLLAVLNRTGGNLPAQLVVLFADLQTGQATIGIIGTGPDGVPAFLGALGLNRFTFPGGDKGAVAQPAAAFIADRWQLFRAASGTDQVRALLTDMMALELTRESPRTDPEKIRRQAARKIKLLPAYRAPSLAVYQLTSGDDIVWLGSGDPRLPRGPLPVMVLTEEDVGPSDEEDTYGRDCPPLDDGEPGIWRAMLGLLNDTPSTPGGPFLGEPALVNWPPDVADRLEQRMREVAGLLHMETGEFIGGFLIAAMVHIDRRCRLLARSGGPPGPQLQQMAAAFGPVRDLFELYLTVMLSRDDRRALPCPVAGKSRRWVREFAETYGSARDDAVAAMFVSSCQDLLLQTLFTSRHELHQRAVNFAEYMPVTRMLMTVMLTDTVELMALRDSLDVKIARETLESGALYGGGLPGPAWIQLADALVDVLSDEPVSREPVAGTTERRRDGWRVYDGKGRWWSRDQLESVISAQRREVAKVDPLLEKILEVEDLVVLLRQAKAADNAASTAAGQAVSSEMDRVFGAEITKLIEENERWTRTAAADRDLAFGLANFRRADARSGSDIGAKLSGIHQLADERLRSQFTDPHAYVSGVGRLAAVEIGKDELTDLLSLVGITVLSIFCPPLGIAIGVAQGIHGLVTAFEHIELQHAMLAGDDILSKAQVEAELWGATIGMALAVLPEVPAAVRGGSRLARAAVRGEATEVAVAATRQAMRKIIANLAELSLARFTKQFAQEMATNYLVDLALAKAMDRIAAAVAQQVAVTGRATTGDIAEVLGRAIQGRPTP